MHFLGLAVGPKNTDEVDAQLEQWSEYTEVNPYASRSGTHGHVEA